MSQTRIKELEKLIEANYTDINSINSYLTEVSQLDPKKLSKVIKKNILRYYKVADLNIIKKIKDSEITFDDDNMEFIISANFDKTRNITIYANIINNYSFTNETIKKAISYSNVTYALNEVIKITNNKNNIAELVLMNTIFYETDLDRLKTNRYSPCINAYGNKFKYYAYGIEKFLANENSAQYYLVEFYYRKYNDLITRDIVLQIFKNIKNMFKYLDILNQYNMSCVNYLLSLHCDNEILFAVFDVIFPNYNCSKLIIKNVDFSTIPHYYNKQCIDNILYYTYTMNLLTDNIIMHAISKNIKHIVLPTLLDNTILYPIVHKKNILNDSTYLYQKKDNKISSFYTVNKDKYFKCSNKVIDIYPLLKNKNWDQLLDIACKYNYDDIFEDCYKQGINPTKQQYINNLEYILSTEKSRISTAKSQIRDNVALDYMHHLVHFSKIFNANYKKLYILEKLAFYRFSINIELVLDLLKKTTIKKTILNDIFKLVEFENTPNLMRHILENELPYPSGLSYDTNTYYSYHNKYLDEANVANINYFKQHNNPNIIELREMCKKGKLAVIKKFMKQYSVQFDQYCINNAYYYNNKEIIALNKYSPTDNCCIYILLKKNKIDYLKDALFRFIDKSENDEILSKSLPTLIG